MRDEPGFQPLLFYLSTTQAVGLGWYYVAPSVLDSVSNGRLFLEVRRRAEKLIWTAVTRSRPFGTVRDQLRL